MSQHNLPQRVTGIQFKNDATTPEEDRATGIGNMHKICGKDRPCGSRDLLADTDRHTHTQTYSSQYFTTVPQAK